MSVQNNLDKNSNDIFYGDFQTLCLVMMYEPQVFLPFLTKNLKTQFANGKTFLRKWKTYFTLGTTLPL